MPTLRPKHRKALRTAARTYLKLYNASIIGTSALTPHNFEEEKATFFKHPGYNPQFMYPKRSLIDISNQIQRERMRIRDLSLPAELSSHILDAYTAIEHSATARNAIGTPFYSQAMRRVYPFRVSKKALYTFRKDAVNPQPIELTPMFDADAMKHYFYQYITSQPHLHDIQVRVDRVNDHIIRVGSKTLTIGAAVKRREANVKRLIVHEIESHILQQQNLRAQKNPLLRIRSHFNRELYAEGMAVYNEIISGTITTNAFDTYYFRARAVEMMQRSFYDIYRYLSKRMTAHRAYLTAYRVKRGMTDTSLPGGYPKDALYLLGYQAVKDYIARGGRPAFLYITQDPELGELLLKYNLLDSWHHTLPNISEIKRHS